jgi:hypothetical protein
MEISTHFSRYAKLHRECVYTHLVVL